jgi:D-lyxose ketol-isomerase
MKRSQVNHVVADAKRLFGEHGFRLPPFAFWTPEQWRGKGHEADEIRTTGLGWDVTDFGLGRFRQCGLLLFTLRNGSAQDAHAYPKPYAEKIMVVQEGQVTPMHFHWSKREDIINRGGGRLVLGLHRCSEDEGLADERFSVPVDGVRRACVPGQRVTLAPGESISIEPRLYHTFWGEAGHGPVIVGEVSSVNEDVSDNRFLEPLGRFPHIEEDEPPLHLLCTEYPPAP